MQKIKTFLTYDGRAEEAVNFYVSLFKNSKIHSIERYTDEVPGFAGKVLGAEFELDGVQFVALDGGPSFKFSEGISLFVSCKDQKEVDDLWNKLIADGGEESMCGWLKDKFGVSWQIIPTTLPELISKAQGAKKMAVINAMLKMRKIEVQALQDAYDQN